MIGKFGKGEEEKELLDIKLSVPLLDDANIENKVILVRADLNLPIREGRVEDTTRIELFAKTTLKELIEKEARIAILTHQGRKGKPTFTTTQIHAELLTKLTGKTFRYVPSLFGEEAEEAMLNLKEGREKFIVLENTRFYEEETANVSMEEHSKSRMVSTLSKYADYYVNDAFASSHRNHASLVGFPFVLPSMAGRIMEWELRAITHILSKENEKTLYLLGGAKVKESLDVISHVLAFNKAMGVAVGGALANAFIGFGEKELVDKAKKLKEIFREKIYVPVDFVENGKDVKREDLKNPPKDIGKESVEHIKLLIDQSTQVFFNGPFGVFEEGYIKASEEILKHIANSNVFSVAGGGHTITLLNRLKMFDKIDHISTGGRALLNAISEKELPAVKALEKGLKP